MSSPNFERVLALLYSDEDARVAFLADPGSFLDGYILSQSERLSLIQIDRVGLQFAAESFAKKRSKRSLHREKIRGESEF